MFQVAMLSKWHVHASEYARRIQEMPDARVSCVWDEDPVRGAAWGKELQVDFEPCLDTLLARPDVDGVVVDTPTSMHEEVILKAAKAGKHIFTEKVLSLTVASCDRIAQAIEQAGVKFCICFPYRTNPAMLYLKQVLDEGLLGEVTLLRVRNGHDGSLAGWLPEYWYDPALTGGGAMMDLGCHPMYLSSWFLGRPTRIASMFNTRAGKAVEENSVCTVEFANKAIAVVETSLVSPFTPSSTELYGTEGTVIAVDGKVRLRSKKLGVEGWIEPAKLPAALPHPTRMWVDGVLKGTPIPFGLAEARALTELMEKAYIADREQRTVEF